jgi:ribosomal-protein-alanine N-acetyltransferase
MQLAHLPAVMAIERETFSMPWPEHAYRHELTQSELAHYYVLCPRGQTGPQGAVSPWQRLIQAIRSRPAVREEPVWGYGGFWMMVDEAHISTLAIRSSLRRRGLGEFLLLALIDEARGIAAHRVTLEVRLANLPAQALYTKYGFEQVGRRKGYYPDNGEDALIMTTPDLDAPVYADLLGARRASLVERLSGLPSYVGQTPLTGLE